MYLQDAQVRKQIVMSCDLLNLAAYELDQCGGLEIIFQGNNRQVWKQLNLDFQTKIHKLLHILWPASLFNIILKPLFQV